MYSRIFAASALLFAGECRADVAGDLLRGTQLDIPNFEAITKRTESAIIENIKPNAVGQSLAIQATNASKSIDPRMVGGTPTTIEDNPWQVALIYGNTPPEVRQQFCGGTLISPNRVLTAAHCVDWLADSSSVDIVAGTSYYGYGGERIKVSKISIHPNWSPNSHSNDFAVLSLASAAQIGRPIAPVAANTDLDEGLNTIVSGWGALSMGGVGSQILMRAAVPVVSTEICNLPESYSGKIDRSMFCAGYRDGGVDSCQGDSGGPVTAQLDSGIQLVGVVSWGEGCALRLKYGVYGRVSFASDWISAQAN